MAKGTYQKGQELQQEFAEFLKTELNWEKADDKFVRAKFWN